MKWLSGETSGVLEQKHFGDKNNDEESTCTHRTQKIDYYQGEEDIENIPSAPGPAKEWLLPSTCTSWFPISHGIWKTKGPIEKGTRLLLSPNPHKKISMDMQNFRDLKVPYRKNAGVLLVGAASQALDPDYPMVRVNNKEFRKINHPLRSEKHKTRDV